MGMNPLQTEAYRSSKDYTSPEDILSTARAVTVNDVISGHLFASTLHQSSAVEPELRLYLAILHDVVNTIAHPKSKRLKLALVYLQALHWIQAEDDEWTFSFNNTCAALSIEATYLRRGLLKVEAQSDEQKRQIERQSQEARSKAKRPRGRPYKQRQQAA